MTAPTPTITTLCGGSHKGFTNEYGDSVRVSVDVRGHQTAEISLHREDELVFRHAVSRLEALAIAEGLRFISATAAPQPATPKSDKDAERYRWLREQHWNVASLLFVIAGTKEQVRLGTDCPSLDRLDALIDAAILGRDEVAA